MSEPRQYTLAIEHPHQQGLDAFVPGANRELIQVLRAPLAERFAGLWICGPAGSGRSHLLRGRCLAALGQGRSIAYVGCRDSTDRSGLLNGLTYASGTGVVVAVDDVGVLAGDAELEHLLLAIYERLAHQRGQLVVSHAAPATRLDFSLPDLNSRMRSLLHYRVEPLSDEDKIELLTRRARHRGYELSRAVVQYWMARGPRDLSALLTDLDVLDRASLARKQRVTIPLLKQVLGY